MTAVDLRKKPRGHQGKRELNNDRYFPDLMVSFRRKTQFLAKLIPVRPAEKAHQFNIAGGWGAWKPFEGSSPFKSPLSNETRINGGFQFSGSRKFEAEVY